MSGNKRWAMWNTPGHFLVQKSIFQILAFFHAVHHLKIVYNLKAYASEQLQWHTWRAFLWIFFMRFHRRCLSTLSTPWWKKSQKWPTTQIKGAGGGGGPARGRALHWMKCHRRRDLLSWSVLTFKFDEGLRAHTPCDRFQHSNVELWLKEVQIFRVSADNVWK